MLQIKKRKDGKSKIRFMATICFYQDGRHDTPLSWMRKVFGIGYLSKRNDGMTELRINGFSQVSGILKDMLPFIRFKKVQANALYRACVLLSKKSLALLNDQDRKKLANEVLLIQTHNYATKRKKTIDELYIILGLTP